MRGTEQKRATGKVALLYGAVRSRRQFALASLTACAVASVSESAGAAATNPVVSIFSLNRTLTPVSAYEADGSVSGNRRRYRWTAGLTLTAGGPIGLSGELGFSGYFDGAQKSPGAADFSYVLAYRAARWPGLKFGYDNYGANQFRPDRGEGERLSNFSDGTWGLTWTLNKTRNTPTWLKWHHTSGVGCSAGLRYSRHFVEAQSKARRNNRLYATLGCKITLFRHAFLTVDTFFYGPRERQSSNADFTWELGWNSYRHTSFAFLYRNYAANRFPWRSGGQSPRLNDGFVTVQWRYVW